MVNDTTLKRLKQLGFGADIDSLESFVLDYRQASLISDLDEHKEGYLEAYRLLEELRPTSEAFGRYRDEKVEQDKYARLFYDYPVPRYHAKYGNNITKMYGYSVEVGEAFMKELRNSGGKDAVCVLYPRGIDVTCIYINGYIYRVYCVGYNSSDEPVIYKNITSYAKGLVKSEIPKLKNNELAELRGKLVIRQEYAWMKKLRRLEECTIADWLRLGVNSDKLEVVYTDLIMDNMEIFDDQWGKLDYMTESLGLLNVANHYFIRNADGLSLQAILKEVKLVAKDDTVYFEYSGIEVRVNSDLLCNKAFTRVLSLVDRVDPDTMFTSTIRSYTFENKTSSIVPVINMVSVNCGNGVYVDKLEIDDVCSIEKYDLYPGNKIKFRVIGDRPLLNTDDYMS